MTLTFTLEMAVALAALACSLYTLHRTNRHNRLSLMPHLQWENRKARGNDGIRFSCYLNNTGTGPAIISDRFFLLDGKRFEPQTGAPVEELARICLTRFRYAVKRHVMPGVGVLVPPGEEICIADVFVPGFKPEHEPLWDEAMKRLDWETIYRSLQGEVFRQTTKAQTT